MSRQMSIRMMSAPSSASRTAWLRPWPRAAPVTRATLPCTRPGFALTSRSPRLPPRGALLGERARPLGGVLGAQQRRDLVEIVLPLIAFVLGTAVPHAVGETLGGPHRQRGVGRDRVGQRQRRLERLAVGHHLVDQTPALRLR